jgi:cytochrome b6-f complex subunit 4
MTVVVKLPSLRNSLICQKLSRGMGHNYFGEPAWPNDILFIFPVVILGLLSISVGLAIGEPVNLGERANPFATPLEILPEWYFYPTFNLLRILPDKLIGVLSLLYVPVILLITPLVENTSKYQNPFRRPLASSLFLTSISYSIVLGIGSLLPLTEALPLCS